MKENLPLQLLDQLRELLEKSRQQLQQNINTTMVHTYWQVGRLIVEQEQQGSERAAYGKQVLKQLSNVLTAEFGKGFDARNLRNMRSFYQTFPKWNAVRTIKLKPRWIEDKTFTLALLMLNHPVKVSSC